jgi:hypothetical protein
MNRRIDPEAPGVVHWPQIWRSLRTSRKCKAVPGEDWLCSGIEWDVDTGYCLDRFSTNAELAEQRKRPAAG